MEWEVYSSVTHVKLGLVIAVVLVVLACGGHF